MYKTRRLQQDLLASVKKTKRLLDLNPQPQQRKKENYHEKISPHTDVIK